MPRKPAPIVHESDEWDGIPLDRLLAMSESIDAIFIDRRKPKQAISMRVDPDLITIAKRIAGQWGLGYQTLFRVWLMEGANRYVRQQGRKPDDEKDEVAMSAPQAAR